jgi:speckle-type POZ protein
MPNRNRDLTNVSGSQHSELTTNTLQFTWQIVNYSSRARNCAPDTAIKSPPFVFYDKESWMQIFFFPKGNDQAENEAEDVGKWSAICLIIESEDRCHGNYHIELAVLNGFGKKLHSRHFHKEIPFPLGWGFDEFICQSELENPKKYLLPDDKLTILCRIEKTDKEVCDCPNEDAQTLVLRRRLVEDYATLLERGTTSDVHFIVQNLKIPAHKAILSARSPVFAAMFQNEMQENSSNEVIVTDVEPDAFKEMLQFIYTGRCQIGAWTEDLFFAADKYDIKDLKEVCEVELRMKLCVDNAIRFLILSDLHRATKLKESCVSFINQNAVEIMKKPAWKDLLKTHPLLVADLYSNVFDVHNEAK